MIFDTTLRDGAQTDGISFSLEDKINIIKALDELGIDFIEAGNPSANEKEREFFNKVSEINLNHAKVVAFGSTCRKDTLPSEDNNCNYLANIKCPVVSIFGKSSVYHVKSILQTTLEENLRMIKDTCKYLKNNDKYVVYDAEHFFDGYMENPAYAIKTLIAAKEGGADNITLCDTNGGTFPDEILTIFSRVKRTLCDIELGIHTHNDCGMAVANTVMAVNAGAKLVQGTFLGFGERAGNANLSTLIPDLQIKREYDCIPNENMQKLTSCARKIAEISNITLRKDLPFVGNSAFTHKAGMHADGVLKDSKSFEHISPEQVGNRRKIPMSEISGKAAILNKVKKIYPNIEKDSDELELITNKIKERENMGYHYDGADGSFELIVRSVVDDLKPSFSLISYKLINELSNISNHSSTATIKLVVNDEQTIAAEEGDGPVNALDRALRKALEKFYPCLNQLHLTDYKVRVLDSNIATAAYVRVLITSTDGKDVWTTVGVSQDIIEASWIAIVDSVEYKLINSKLEF